MGSITVKAFLLFSKINFLSETLGDTQFSSFSFYEQEPSSVTIRWKAVEQYFTVVMFVLPFLPVCNLGKVIHFGLGTLKSEKDEIAIA